MTENLDELAGAYEADFPFIDEIGVMERWYGKRLLESLKERGDTSLLSLGLGTGELASTLIKLGNLKHYDIVEGSNVIIDRFLAAEEPPEWVGVTHSYFEEFDTAQTYDTIEMAYILEHVDDPLAILRRFSAFLKPGGCIVAAVPNATSLHRQVGFRAGLLPDMYAFTKTDLELGHKHYFDVDSFSKLVRDAGLNVDKLEGVFLKPVAASQLSALNVGSDIYRAFCELGVNYPELSNGILAVISK